MNKLKEFAKKTKNNLNIFVCYYNIFNSKRSQFIKYMKKQKNIQLPYGVVNKEK